MKRSVVRALTTRADVLRVHKEVCWFPKRNPLQSQFISRITYKRTGRTARKAAGWRLRRNISSSRAIIDPETSYDHTLIPIKYGIVQLLCLSRVLLVEIAPRALKQNTARERCQSPWKRHTRDL